MDRRFLHRICFIGLLLFCITACSLNRVNIELMTDLVIEYGDTLDNSKLFDANKSSDELEVVHIEYFNSKKVGKQEIVISFLYKDKKIVKTTTIEIKDTQKPIIELKEDKISLNKGTTLDHTTIIDRIYDPVDGNLKLGVENEKGSYWIGLGALDINSVGEYEVSINALDKNGLEADTSKVKVVVLEDKKIVNVENNKNSSIGGGVNESNKNNSSTDKQLNDRNKAESNVLVPDRSKEKPKKNPKGPKPEPGTVVQADDFPEDGWRWKRNTYCWIPKESSWGEEPERELELITWQISPNSLSPDIAYIIDGIESARKYMPPPPTFEESKKLVNYENIHNIKYGETVLYVYIEE